MNPADPTAVATPISVGVAQEASTCCIFGFTDACSQETISYVFATDCTKTTTVTYSDGTPTSSTDEVVTQDQCCLEGYTLNDSGLIPACSSTTPTYTYTAPVPADPDNGITEVLESCDSTADYLQNDGLTLIVGTPAIATHALSVCC